MVEVKRKRKRKEVEEEVSETVEVIKEVNANGRARLTSKLDYPVTIKYGDEKIRISPRSKMVVEDSSKLDKLPTGILLKKV